MDRGVVSTVAPPAASRFTIAAPMPLVPPVTSAVFTLNSAISRGFCSECIITSVGYFSYFTRNSSLGKAGSYSKVGLGAESMARREHPEVDNTHEPLAKLLGILSSPWTLLLLHRLHIEGPKRFGELRRRLGGISTKTLTDRLRMLEAAEWVTRPYEQTVP